LVLSAFDQGHERQPALDFDALDLADGKALDFPEELSNLLLQREVALGDLVPGTVLSAELHGTDGVRLP